MPSFLPWAEVTLHQLIVIYEELLMDQNLKQKQSNIDTWELSAHVVFLFDGRHSLHPGQKS